MSEKKVTIRDLQTFIEAVEFASDQEEWTPSPRQWKRIKEMINNLQEAAPAPPPPAARPAYPPPNFGPPMMGAPMAVPAGPSGLTLPTATPAAPVQLPPVLNTGGQQPARTPDIDTSNGKYQSSFA